MSNIKHSKFSNTAIIYDSLMKQIIQDSLSENKSPAIKIYKKYFKTESLLNKELNLYNALFNMKFKNEERALYFIDRLKESRKRINNAQLKKERYELINEIKNNYNIEHFFKSDIREYKEYASLYKIFEYSEFDHPSEINRCKFTLCEHLVNKPDKKEITSEVVDEFKKLPKDVRGISYKILVREFNNKYSNLLSEEQKDLLRKLILNTNKIEFLNYFKNSAKSIKEQLDKIKHKDPVIQIKINEVSSLLCNYKNSKIINENDVYALMRYYDLLNEIKGKK